MTYNPAEIENMRRMKIQMQEAGFKWAAYVLHCRISGIPCPTIKEKANYHAVNKSNTLKKQTIADS